MTVNHCDECDAMHNFGFKILLYMIFNTSHFLFKAIFRSVTLLWRVWRMV